MYNHRYIYILHIFYVIYIMILGCGVRNLENPRKEDAENELVVSNKKFCNLGLNPITVELGYFQKFNIYQYILF